MGQQTLQIRTAYAEVIQSHREWLERFPSAHGNRWENLLRDQPEAAVCEACVRQVLDDHVEVVEPGEDPSHGGPDFRCSQRGQIFYVESTCITSHVATEETGLSSTLDIDGGFREHSNLTRIILGECRNKARQCSKVDAPCLLAIGTLHFEASMVCCGQSHVEHVLTSRPSISMAFDAALAQAVGEMFQTTDLRWSAVIRPANGTLLEPARQSISALLVCGFGCRLWEVNGVLHPDPVRRFERELLPKIPFCRFTPEYSAGRLMVQWI